MSEQSNMLSVVIPAYNQAQFLKAAAESVLSQSWKNVEVVVVDDGSTDNTPEVMSAIRDPRLKYHWQQNSGPGSALNRGIDLAQGEYVCFLGHDDLLHPDYAATLVGALAKDSRYAVAYCYAQNIDANVKLLSSYGIDRPPKSGDVFVDYVFKRIPILIQCCVFRRAVLNTVGFFDVNINPEDFDFLARVSFGHEFLGLGGHYVYLRKHDQGSQRSGIDRAQQVIAFAQGRLTAMDRLLASHPPDTRNFPVFFRRRFFGKQYNYIARHLMRLGDSREALTFTWRGLRATPWRISLLWKLGFILAWPVGGRWAYQRVYRKLSSISDGRVKERVRRLLK